MALQPMIFKSELVVDLVMAEFVISGCAEIHVFFVNIEFLGMASGAKIRNCFLIIEMSENKYFFKFRRFVSFFVEFPAAKLHSAEF